MPVADDYNRGGRMEHARNIEANKRRAPRNEAEPAKEPAPAAQTAPTVQPEEQDADEKPPIPDDLSEISDDPDDILEREDVSHTNNNNIFIAHRIGLLLISDNFFLCGGRLR